MITLHHLDNSRSQRILWLLEEIGIEYEVKLYKRDSKTMRAPAALRDIHPLGKSPVITDGAIRVAESGAIIEYLIETYAPKLRPDAGTEAARRYTYWLHFAEGSLMPPLLVRLVLSQLTGPRVPFLVRPIARMLANKLNSSFTNPEIERLFAYVDAALSDRDWFAGDELTGADIQMSFPIEAASARGGLDASHTNIRAWLDRIHERPAYKRALERGGKFGIIGG